MAHAQFPEETATFESSKLKCPPFIDFTDQLPDIGHDHESVYNMEDGVCGSGQQAILWYFLS